MGHAQCTGSLFALLCSSAAAFSWPGARDSPAVRPSAATPAAGSPRPTLVAERKSPQAFVRTLDSAVHGLSSWSIGFAAALVGAVLRRQADSGAAARLRASRLALRALQCGREARSSEPAQRGNRRSSARVVLAAGAAAAEPPLAEESEDAPPAQRQEGEQVVTPWEVEAGEDGVDYDKLIKTFGCEAITLEQVARIERLTGRRAHRFLRRGLFFSHRDLDALLDAYEKGELFYIYTGRGPSSESLHLGHLVPFLFTKWLQEAFDVPLVIELTDDEKFLFKDGLSIEEARRLGFENARDIIAIGFDPAKTFIFRDTDYIRELYPVALQIQKRVTLGQAQNTFGFTRSDNIGKVAFAAIQASPSFAQSFPSFLRPGMRCFVPQAIDQDPYFRICRNVAEKLRWPKPALIHSKFLPALQGHQTKMSASVESTALYMTDTGKKLRKKINKHAFSGGGATLEEQQANGADLSVDVSYQYLKIWLEDDEELASIGEAYAAGKMLTGEVKKRLGDVVAEIVGEHQEARARVDDATVHRFMDPLREELAGRWLGQQESRTQAADTREAQLA